VAKSIDESYERLFKIGIIGEWFLRESQKPFFNLVRNNRQSVIMTRRRFGKSSTVLVEFSEIAQVEKVEMRAGGITRAAIKQILSNCLDHIYAFCPKYAPKYYHQDGCFVYPATDSKIYIFGMSNSEEANKARGNECDYVYCDEYGFWKFNPSYTVNSVLAPLLEHSKYGKLIITSTIPKDLTHDYLKRCRDARENGIFFYHDINDSLKAGDITDKEYTEIARMSGGVDSEDFRREYLLQEIASTSDLIVPEAQDESLYVGEVERPQFYKSYVQLDLGLKDKSVALFGYYNFDLNRLVIEREHVANYTTTEDKVAEYKIIEQELGYLTPRRLSDNDAQQLFDMNNSFKYPISPIVKRRKHDVMKQDKSSLAESLINQLRIGISQGKVLISEDCPVLIMSLKYGIWNDNRTDFERNEALGHWDAGMALCYLYDNIDWKANPYPILPPGVKESTHYIPPDLKNKTAELKLAKIVGKKL
jgi:hypothetical protein